MRQAAFIAAPLAAAAIAVAGCGSGSPTNSTTTAPAAAPTSTSVKTIPYDTECVNGTDTANGSPCTPPPMSSSTTATSLPSTSSPNTTSTTAPSVNLTGPVGRGFTDTDAQGNEMQVTLTGLIDPASSGNDIVIPQSGSRFVAAKFSIEGVSGMFSDDANTNASVIGSNGQTYTPWFQEIDSCTNFNNGDFNVSPGQTVSGCVLFQMPQGVAVQSVQWKPVLSSTGPATWTVH